MVESSQETKASTMTDEQLQNFILGHLDKSEGNKIADSNSLVEATENAPVAQIDAALKSLVADEYIALKVIEKKQIELTEEGAQYATKGTPEFQYTMALKVGEETEKTAVEAIVGAQIAKIGFAKAMKNKWVKISADKKSVERIAEEIKDDEKDQLAAFLSENRIESYDKKLIDGIKKRKLITIVSKKSYEVTKGANYATQRVKLETNLTADMLRSGEWKNQQFKSYNFNAQGQVINGGHLHPLLKQRAQYREIFLELGFEEMPTQKFVESSFWNFDSLFQPQAHPARDAHDTFFLKNPTHCKHVPEDYKERVKNTHENGLEGSFGYQNTWSVDEAMKNVLRTHTTAISSQMLYKLAQLGKENFKPHKFFSIDRVFRNETLDATHLAEFHQIEGVIVDKGIGLSHLLGVMKTFFAKIGIEKMKFKPAYNPYTEPSLEIFGYHPTLKKWVEIGNSGVFRPEMLQPMGFDPDVSVIAWGLSLERPTMIYYDIHNIRDLFGHKVSLKSTKQNPVCYVQSS